MRNINQGVDWRGKTIPQLIDYGYNIGEYTDRMEEIDDLLEKYYYQFLEEGYSYESAADKAHQQVEADGIPYEEHSLVSLSNLYPKHHKEKK